MTHLNPCTTRAATTSSISTRRCGKRFARRQRPQGGSQPRGLPAAFWYAVPLHSGHVA